MSEEFDLDWHGSNPRRGARRGVFGASRSSRVPTRRSTACVSVRNPKEEPPNNPEILRRLLNDLLERTSDQTIGTVTASAEEILSEQD